MGEQSKEIVDMMHTEFCDKLQNLIVEHSEKWAGIIPCGTCRYAIMNVALESAAAVIAATVRGHNDDDTMH